MAECTAKTATALANAKSESTLLHRRCACGNHSIGGAECGSCARRRLAHARHGNESNPAFAPPSVYAALRAPGHALDASTQRLMANRFGRDFSDIRVHTDTTAATSAREIHAHAYTVGQDIVFAPGRYRPATDEGQHLIAHELAHVTQKSIATPSPGRLRISDPHDAEEVSADRAANVVMRGGHVGNMSMPMSAGLHRQHAETQPVGTGLPEMQGYDGCVGDSRSNLEAARTDAARLAGHAAEVLGDTANPEVGRLLAKHFRVDIASDTGRAAVPLIRNQFTRMQQGLNSGIRILCRSSPSAVHHGAAPPADASCDGGKTIKLGNSTSCANNNPTATVTLCEAALSEITRPLRQVLLHEFAHVACDGNPQITSGGAGETYYDGSKPLPANGSNVLTEADSYAWFAIEAERIAASTGTADQGKPDHTGWGVLTALGGLAAAGGTAALIAGAVLGSGLAMGLGIAGIVLGAVALGIGIAGLVGAFDPHRTRDRKASAPGGMTPAATNAPSLEHLASMSAWQLAQLPASAFLAAPRGAATAPATSGGAAPATNSSASLEDYARAWSMVRCIQDFHHINVDPDHAGLLGRDPNDAEWTVLRRTLSQIMQHNNVGALVHGPGGRGDLGAQPLSGKVRIADPLSFGIKRYQLETAISSIGADADKLVRQWWSEPRCAITAKPDAHIVDQERRMAVLSETIMQGKGAEGGFYLPQDDAIYLTESTARKLTGTPPANQDATVTVGHEMVHLLAGREGTRKAFMTYFPGSRWICYWSPFEEGMAEITARDALGAQSGGGDRIYKTNVELMRDIMRDLGEEPVRRAYFTGTPGRDIFEALRARLPSHMDPSLPPVCRSPEGS